MMLKKCSAAIPFIVFILLTACSNDPPTESADTEEKEGEIITISAAASLTDAMNDIAALFIEENPNVQVDYNFGGSGALKQQILQGAPVDLFFSASESDFQEVVDEGYMGEANTLDLLVNELVLIVPKGEDTVTSFDNLSRAKRIAIGNPDSVPAGAYSVEAFETMGIREELEDLFVFAEDVRAVLTYVETGNIDAGTVYKTDAMTSEKIEIVDVAPADSHTPIVYPVGLMNRADHAEAAKTFYEYLQTDAALKVFENYGFSIH